MKIGKIELEKEQLIIAIIIATVIIALGAYLIIYAPLMKKVGTKYLECKSIENDVLECRNIIESAGKIYEERILITEKEAAKAIDELTKYGKEEGIHFTSISPKEIMKGEDPLYKILPIKMEIKSNYKEFGIFIGSLDELDKGLVRIKGFDIEANELDPSGLTADLIMDMYFPAIEAGRYETIPTIIPAKRAAKKTEFVAWGRNPFTPHGVRGTGVSGLVLNGIVWDEKKPAAIINDEIVVMGDKLGNNTIVDIKHNKVIVNDGTTYFELIITQEE